jgi:hypothetical protein
MTLFPGRRYGKFWLEQETYWLRFTAARVGCMASQVSQSITTLVTAVGREIVRVMPLIVTVPLPVTVSFGFAVCRVGFVIVSPELVIDVSVSPDISHL